VRGSIELICNVHGADLVILSIPFHVTARERPKVMSNDDSPVISQSSPILTLPRA
jgi:hypothetical protein